jgi:hypothetical protein
MLIQEAELGVLMDLVKKSIMRRWGWMNAIDDVLAESRLGAWKALTDHAAHVEATRHPGADPLCRRVARRGGLSAAVEWLRGPQNQERRTSRRGQAIPRAVSIEALAFEPGTSDFSTAVTEQVDQAALTERWRRAVGASPTDWELLRRTLIEGEDLVQVARELGLVYGSQLKRRHRELLLRLTAAETDF